MGRIVKGEDAIIFLPVDHLHPISHLSSMHNRQKETSFYWGCSSLPLSLTWVTFILQVTPHFLSPQGPFSMLLALSESLSLLVGGKEQTMLTMYHQHLLPLLASNSAQWHNW